VIINKVKSPKPGDLVRRYLIPRADPNGTTTQRGVVLEHFLATGFRGMDVDTAEVYWFTCPDRKQSIETDFVTVLEAVK